MLETIELSISGIWDKDESKMLKDGVGVRII
jgi:hypothetical protein